MDKKVVNKKLLKDYISCGYKGEESLSFHNDKYFLKFLNQESLEEDREKIIEGIHNFNHPDIVVPEFALVEKRKFVGYGMQYMKGYKPIGTLITNDFDKDEEFQKRKELMQKLCRIFDYFDTQEFAYFDIYEDNILYKDGDIKLIDLDGGVLKPYKNCNLDYNAAIRKSKKQLALYTLSFLYNMDFVTFRLLMSSLDNKTRTTLFNHLPKEIKEYYEHALNYDYGVYYGTTKAVDSFTEDLYLETKDIIKKRLI